MNAVPVCVCVVAPSSAAGDRTAEPLPPSPRCSFAGVSGRGSPDLRILPAPPTVESWGFPEAGKPRKIFAFPFICLSSDGRHCYPATRCGSGELAPSPATIRFRKSEGTSGRHWDAARPPLSNASENSGFAPNVTKCGPGSVRVSRDLRSGTVEVARHPEQRSHPSLGLVDLPDPSA